MTKENNNDYNDLINKTIGGWRNQIDTSEQACERYRESIIEFEAHNKDIQKLIVILEASLLPEEVTADDE